MILIDSSVLIEYIKGNKTELLEAIFENNLQPCINHIIYSEFIYYYLSVMSGKSPLTLKTRTMEIFIGTLVFKILAFL